VAADPNDLFYLSRRTVIGLAAAVGMGVAVSSPRQPVAAQQA
jgi:hypothetical protein